MNDKTNAKFIFTKNQMLLKINKIANGEANRMLYEALFFAEKTLEPLYIIFTLFT